MVGRALLTCCLLGLAACSVRGGSDKNSGLDVPTLPDPGVEDSEVQPSEDPGLSDEPGASEDLTTVPETLPADPGVFDPGEPDPGQPDPGPTDPGQPDIPTTPPGHTENDGGVMHMPGKDDPLKNCVACHGQKLTGGTGPSCYSCHNANDHTKKHGGVKHKSGSSATCKACHGPSNNGGLGPACSKCH